MADLYGESFEIVPRRIVLHIDGAGPASAVAVFRRRDTPVFHLKPPVGSPHHGRGRNRLRCSDPTRVQRTSNHPPPTPAHSGLDSSSCPLQRDDNIGDAASPSTRRSAAPSMA